jgi:hypothetical protein
MKKKRNEFLIANFIGTLSLPAEFLIANSLEPFPPGAVGFDATGGATTIDLGGILR